MRFTNTSRVITVRFDEVDSEWVVWSPVAEGWMSSAVPDFYTWEEVQDHYNSFGQRVRYSTSQPVLAAV